MTAPVAAGTCDARSTSGRLLARTNDGNRFWLRSGLASRIQDCLHRCKECKSGREGEEASHPHAPPLDSQNALGRVGKRSGSVGELISRRKWPTTPFALAPSLFLCFRLPQASSILILCSQNITFPPLASHRQEGGKMPVLLEARQTKITAAEFAKWKEKREKEAFQAREAAAAQRREAIKAGRVGIEQLTGRELFEYHPELFEGY